MKVLILGASGFIGLPVAQAFVRAGHICYGQTRSKETAKQLAKEEIVPVVCDPYSEEGKAVWGKVAAHVDVFVDILKTNGPAAALGTLHHFISATASRPKATPLPTYIYTGGLWSLTRGPGGLESWTDERQPRSGYNAAVGWRAEIEDPLLQETRLNGIVIRPPIMYGRSQSFVASYILDAAYEAGKNGEVFETFGRAETRWQTCHQDDVGELFVRVGERGHICKGQTFLAANPQSERLTDVLDAVVRVSGAKGYRLKDPEEAYDKAWVSTLNVRPSLGTALTGWYPRKMGLVDGMDVYWASYVASRE